MTETKLRKTDALLKNLATTAIPAYWWFYF